MPISYRHFRTAIAQRGLKELLHSPVFPILGKKSTQLSTTSIQQYLQANAIVYSASFEDALLSKDATLPRVFFGKHFSFLDPLLIIDSMQLEAFKLLAVPSIELLYPVLAPHIIPVPSRSLIGYGWETSVVMSLYHLTEGYTVAEADQLRRQVITSAVAALEETKNLLLFPDGGVKKDWFDGIGFLIYQYFTQHPEAKLQLQPFHIRGVSNQRLFTHNARLVIKQRAPWHIHVDYPRPIILDKHLVDHLSQSGKTIKEKSKLIKAWIQEEYLHTYADANTSATSFLKR